MNKIIGYGEDALTLWALRKEPESILNQLNESVSSGYTFIYRPSFGRSGVKCFGEFDAILATTNKIYLVESKWDHLKHSDVQKIKLFKKQLLRHKIFRWYYENWTNLQPQSWEKFRNTVKGKFKKRFKGRDIPTENTLLAKNLEKILNKLGQICSRDTKLVDVLLYFYHENGDEFIKTTGAPDNFKLIPLKYSECFPDLT